jgi:3-deoxy-7-phosphoheptulonate synthase
MSIVDPGHGTGAWDLVCPMAKAAVVVGAAGLMIEVHQDPAAIRSDGFQSLKPETFRLDLNRVRGLSVFVRSSPMFGAKPQANS